MPAGQNDKSFAWGLAVEWLNQEDSMWGIFGHLGRVGRTNNL